MVNHFLRSGGHVTQVKKPGLLLLRFRMGEPPVQATAVDSIGAHCSRHER
jgi:hypothetical protein